ncbi:MAG: hypothetical protein ABEJ36_00265 [Candidatus Nanosalina sp.]
MELQQHHCKKITALVFLVSSLISIIVLRTLEIPGITSIAGGAFIGIFTAGIWLEVSYRFLVKQATAPLDKLVEKL